MMKKLMARAVMVLALLPALLVPADHAVAGKRTKEYQLGYRAGYLAGERDVNKGLEHLWGACGTAQAGTALQVWRIGLDAPASCSYDSNNAGWYALGSRNGGLVNGTVVCWWVAGKQTILVIDSGLLQSGSAYCIAHNPLEVHANGY